MVCLRVCLRVSLRVSLLVRVTLSLRPAPRTPRGDDGTGRCAEGLGLGLGFIGAPAHLAILRFGLGSELT